MKTERRTLVTSEDEIRVRDLLSIDCAWCNESHLFLVTKIYRGTFCIVIPGRPDEHAEDAVVVVGMPNPVPCIKVRLTRLSELTPRAAIRERRLYRIDTGLLDEENPYTARKQMVGRSKRVQQRART